MGTRGWAGLAALAIGMIILVGCSGDGTRAGQSPAPSPGTSVAPPPAPLSSVTAAPPPAPSYSVAATGSTMLDIVVCPTTFGITNPELPHLPTRLGTNVPAALAGRLSVYTDRQGVLYVIAPAGWRCAALDAADGSPSVTVVPPGTSPQPSVRGFTSDRREAVAASGTSACRGCTYALVCPLLPDPAGAAVYGACPHARPAGESVTHPSSSTAAFGDPPGITGDGAPSWGPYPANGLIIHHPPTANPGAETGYIETCTLPEADHALCTAALNDFLRRYE